MDKNELLHNYFENSLSPEEKNLFDNLLVTDEEFAQEVVFQKNLKKAITLEERAHLKEKLNSYEQQNTPKTKWWYVAASFLVLLGMSFWFINQNPDYDKLYASYFEIYPNVVEPIVRNSNEEKTIKMEAFIAYENEDYAKASQLFESIAMENQVEYAQFYKAISLMKIDQFDEASVILSDTSWSNAYHEDATWYLALIKLKQQDITASKKLLKILTTTSIYAMEARELLKRLD
ncbi:MAG: hypothetical protein H0X63_01500 [Flavobacteriales bacterium]|jgi:hypothetical protein|nr:hypothetical protein [Flavobacteriales bacterium]